MPKRKKRMNKKQSTNSIINNAIEQGIDVILELHPRFKENQNYILRHIDKKKLNEKIEKIYENTRERGWSNEKKLEYIRKELTDYVATGAAFDEAGKEVILKSGLEEKARSGLFRGWSARRRLEGEKYLDNVIVAFQDLYSLFKTGEYAENMPEVADAVTTVYEMGFLDPAVDVLKHYNLISPKKYKVLKGSIREKTEEGIGRAMSGIEKYATHKKVAAFILGILGILVLISSGIRITGNVVGNLSNTTTGIIGFFLILISLVFFIWKKK